MYNLVKVSILKNVTYMIAILLLMSWAIGVFIFSLKGLIHLFLVFSIIVFLISIIRSEI